MKSNNKDNVSRLYELVPSSLLERPPVDINAIGSYLGVQEVVVRPLNIPGFLRVVGDGKSIVFLNEENPARRQRFTHAHEIGHLLLSGHGEGEIFCREATMNPKALERACDAVATEILMPRRVFGNTANRFGWTLDSVRQLASYFEVSLTAAAIRLFELIQEPMAISYWRVRQDVRKYLKQIWLRTNEFGRPLKPDFRTRPRLDTAEPINLAIDGYGMKAGATKVLLTQDGITRSGTMLTEALGIGSGRNRTILAFHYLSRSL